MEFESKYDRAEPKSLLSVEGANHLLGKFLAGRSIELLVPLSGGYLNSNFKVVISGSEYVLRISNRHPEALPVEISILEHLEKELLSPKVVFFENTNTPPFALLTYLKGVPLYLAEDKFATSDIKNIGSDIGQILAAIHRKEFSRSGDFDAKFNIQDGLEDFIPAIKYETQRCLNNEKLKSRFSSEDHSKICKFIEINSNLLDSLAQRRLTHSDFNQKNILVDKINGNWKVTGIIDWEYAFSGPFLFDFGNFFRFEEEMPPYREHVVEAYKKHGGVLPANWMKVAKFLDLLPQLQFLAMDADTPKTFETAKSVIRKTLSDWC